MKQAYEYLVIVNGFVHINIYLSVYHKKYKTLQMFILMSDSLLVGFERSLRQHHSWKEPNLHFR